MRRMLILILLLLPLLTLSQKKKPNIINYFASNNQIVGVPMVDLDNEFRFYPDLSFQEAISSIVVYYFVLNDVYKHHLVKREDGRYWAAVIRDFSLGESIQRVEVIVDCGRHDLDKILDNFGITNSSYDGFQKYLFLRRGDDDNLYRLAYAQSMRNVNIEASKISSSVIELRNCQEELIRKVAGLSAEVSKPRPEIKLTSLSAHGIEEITNQFKPDTTVSDITLQKIRAPLKRLLPDIKILNQKDFPKDSMRILKSNRQIDSLLKEVESVSKRYDEKYSRFKFEDSKPTELFTSKDFELIKNISISSDPKSRLYSAYVENRLSSMLDMKYKHGSEKKIIQFNYRNDKQFLQYLQADDPQEKLGIFRARLVPFPFYRQPVTDANGNINDDFKWQRGKVIYEIGVTFGYTVVKDDHFTPKFFDMHRLGLAIGISSDTFTNNPTFLSMSLSYDVNTYTSLSFGANLVDKPGFYMGVGINARAFKDLVKNSATLFKGN